MTITYRQTKGSALTYGEVDENFRDLYEDTDLQRVLTNGNTATVGMTVSHLTANSLIVSNSSTKTAGSEGTPGQISWDANYIYVCVATNSWKRVAFTSWI